MFIRFDTTLLVETQRGLYQFVVVLYVVHLRILTSNMERIVLGHLQTQPWSLLADTRFLLLIYIDKGPIHLSRYVVLSEDRFYTIKIPMTGCTVERRRASRRCEAKCAPPTSWKFEMVCKYFSASFTWFISVAFYLPFITEIWGIVVGIFFIETVSIRKKTNIKTKLVRICLIKTFSGCLHFVHSIYNLLPWIYQKARTYRIIGK